MSSLGNFLLGSYVTGFFFMLFFVEEISRTPIETITKYRANIMEKLLVGIIWPIPAVCFLFIRLNLFFMGK